MSQNWMRHFELQLLSDNGRGITLSDFRVTFTIDWNSANAERVASVKVYNLSTETNNKILKKEFSKMRVIAGYDGVAPAANAFNAQAGNMDGPNYGDIFNGDIRFTITGKDQIKDKDNVADSWISIQAIDGLQATLYSQPSATLAANWTIPHLHRLVMSDYKPFEVTPGITGTMPNYVFQRERTIFMPSRDVMDNIAGQCKGYWQMVDGKLELVPYDSYTTSAIELNSNTGLIGMPQQTMDEGISVQCLINPAIRVSGLIHLKQGAVYQLVSTNKEIIADLKAAAETGNKDKKATSKPKPASIATDGVYKVMHIVYDGDTRGQNWYMKLNCVAQGTRDIVNYSTLTHT